MDLTSLISKLHPLERKVLPFLKSEKELSNLVKASGMQEIEVMRALQWLENKDVLHLRTEAKKVIVLGKNGLKYKQEGMPEKKLLKALTGEFQSLSEITKKSGLEREEVDACIGILKRKVGIELQKEKELMLKLGSQGKKILSEGTLEEQFLTKNFPLELEKLSDVEKFSLEELKKRKEFVYTEETRKVTISLTELGKKIIAAKISTGEVINRLTPEMLKTGSWKDKEFRAYDIQAQVPSIYPGKKHFVNQAIEYAKQIWLEMGFKEMTGSIVNTSFWCMDALFVPQDHPARTWTDTYHLKNPTHGKLPNDLVVNRIKMAHEDGGRTGSTGWGYKWNPDIARQLMPRAHGTAVSARQMVKGIEIPSKYFTISRVYRPDVLDATHLIEFNQLDGFVTDKSINFRTLLGMLKLFAEEVAGAEEVKFFPDYYPFTEPSVQISAKHPQLGWVELGGAGIFRPEITETLGIDTPVMAWGLGIDRLAMFKLGIKDIRYLFSQDLKWLREARII